MKRTPTKFWTPEAAEKARNNDPGLTVYGGNGDEKGRWYWAVGTHCHSITDVILYI